MTPEQELRAMVDFVCESAGAPAGGSARPGAVLIAIYLLGYRRTGERFPVQALAQPPQQPADLPPPTPPVDELFRRLT